MIPEANTAEALEPNALAGEAQPAPESQETSPEPQPTETTPHQHGNKGRQPWYMDRIAENQRKADQARAAAEEASRRAAAAEEMLARMQQRGAPQDPAPTPAPPQQQQPDFQSAVHQAAAEQRFYEDVQAVRAAALDKFPDFNQSVEILGAVGIGNPAVLADLFAVDKSNAHVILDQLAKDPERAALLAEMDPRRRIAEFTRMSDASKSKSKTPATPAPQVPAAGARVSKAPAPAPRIDTSTTRVIDGYSDEASDEEFTAKFYARMKERAGLWRR